MKKTAKILAVVLLAALFVCAAFATSVFAETAASTGLTYAENGDGTYTVSGVGTFSGNDLVIPATYNGGAVTAIADRAFFGYANIQTVTIPASVSVIGDYAFAGCANLSAITVADDNEVYASLDGNLYTEDMYTLVQYAVGKTDASFEIPEGVGTIGHHAFYKARSLTIVTIPATVIAIKSNLLDSDTPVVDPDGNGVAILDTAAFTGCTSLSTVNYDGLKSEWERISIGVGNEILTNATINFAEHVHELVVYEGQEPTCTEDGFKTFEVCTLCDYNTYEPIPALGHNIIDVEAKEGDCTNEGWNAHEACTRCDYSTAIKTPALGHDEVSHEGLAATCTTDGYKAYVTCTKCDYTTYEVIEATGHETISHKAKAPNCTDIGWAAYESCSKCDYTTYKEIPATGHNLQNFDAKAAGCGNIGWDAHVACSKCSYSTIVVIPATGHNFVNGACYYCAQPATASAGLEFVRNVDGTYSVAGIGSCTDSYVIIPETYLGKPVSKIAASAFEGTAITGVMIPAGVISIGDYAFSGCTSLTEIKVNVKNADYKSVDGNLYTADGKTLVQYAIGKDATEFVIPEGVEVIGKSAFAYSALKSVTIPASVTAILGHLDTSSLDTPLAGPNVTKFIVSAFYACDALTDVYYDGSAEDWALVAIGCGNESLRAAKLTTAVVEHVHNIVSVDGKDATCTDAGYKAYEYCSECDEYTTYEEIPALGHTITSVEGKDATCTDAGYKAYEYCSVCDYTTYEEIEALGHNEIFHEGTGGSCFINGVKDYVTCSRCDYTTYEETVATGHSLVSHEGKLPTCYETGYMAYYTCENCDYTTYHELAAYGHDIVRYLAVDATCTEPGHKAYEICKRCDYTTYEEVAPLGHNEISFSAVAPTCTEPGNNAYVVCSRCSYTTYERIPATGHNFVDGSCSCGATDNSSTGLTFTKNADGSYTLAKSTGFTGTTLVVPATYNGAPVTAIAASAFSGNKTLVSVVIPSSVITIGKSAFSSCSNLVSVDLGEGVQSIGQRAFYNCTSLAEIAIPGSVTTMEAYIFQNCTGLVKASVDCATLGQYLFTGCTALKHVYISKNVTKIENYAFNLCNGILLVEYAGTKAQFGTITIGISNAAITTSKNIYLLDYPADKQTAGLVFTSNGDGTCVLTGFGTCKDSDVVIPYLSPAGDVVVGIDTPNAYGVFRNRTITSVVIPNTVTYIGASTFRSCKSLASVVLGDSVATIGDQAFAFCSALTEMVLTDYVTSLGLNAFQNCTGITRVVIGERMKSIGTYAFSGCTALEDIYIGRLVLTFEYNAFYNCKAIKSVTYNNTMSTWRSITDKGGNSAIVKIDWKNLTLIGHEHNLVVNEGKAPNCWDPGYADYLTCTTCAYTNYTVLEGVGHRYKNGFCTFCGGSESAEGIAYKSNGDGTCIITGIGDCTSTDIVLSWRSPAGDIVTSIQARAFNGNTQITSIVIPDTVLTIGIRAFSSCTNLKSVTIGNSVTNIGTRAFYGLPITEIVIPASVEKIDNYAFQNCTSLAMADIDADVVGGYIFAGCTSLKTVYLGTNVSTIHYGCFYDCPVADLYYKGVENDYYANVAMNQNVVNWLTKTSKATFHFAEHDHVLVENAAKAEGCVNVGWDAFYTCELCSYTTKVEIPATGHSIGADGYCTKCLVHESAVGLNYVSNGDGTCYVAGIGTSKFTDIIIPSVSPLGETVVAIGARAFNAKANITSVVIPDTVTDIQASAFLKCTALTTVTIGTGVKTIGQYAFSGCTALATVNYGGDATAWAAITVEAYNDPLKKATFNYAA